MYKGTHNINIYKSFSHEIIAKIVSIISCIILTVIIKNIVHNMIYTCVLSLHRHNEECIVMTHGTKIHERNGTNYEGVISLLEWHIRQMRTSVISLFNHYSSLITSPWQKKNRTPPPPKKHTQSKTKQNNNNNKNHTLITPRKYGT